jgi:hypothetical protein
MVRCSIFATLRGYGARRAYSYVRGDNPVGIKAARRWQQEVATVRYLLLPGLRPIVFGSGSKRLRRSSSARTAARWPSGRRVSCSGESGSRAGCASR